MPTLPSPSHLMVAFEDEHVVANAGLALLGDVATGTCTLVARHVPAQLFLRSRTSPRSGARAALGVDSGLANYAQ
jgi:hypothetical protein